MTRDRISRGFIAALLAAVMLSGCTPPSRRQDFPAQGVEQRQPVMEREKASPALPQESGREKVQAEKPENSARAKTGLLPEDALPVQVRASALQPKAEGECYQLIPTLRAADPKKQRRCEPQCIPYVRCRSGINSCRLGLENGPLTWFACEQRHGNTAAVPLVGSVLILSANARRNMPTGHGLYVEDVVAEGEGVFRLLLSHTNFDRQCSLETRVAARFDQTRMAIDFLSGAWQPWGHGLQVAGFILGDRSASTSP